MDLASRDVAATVLDLANLDQGCLVIARTPLDRPRYEQNAPSPTLTWLLEGGPGRPISESAAVRPAVAQGAASSSSRPPTLPGERTLAITLRDADGSTEVIGGTTLPRGVAPADHELGGRMALDPLAELVEAPRSQPRP